MMATNEAVLMMDPPTCRLLDSSVGFYRQWPERKRDWISCKERGAFELILVVGSPFA